MQKSSGLREVWLNSPIEGKEEYHVIPDFGRDHELTLHCWCHPDRDEDEPRVIIHNVEN